MVRPAALQPLTRAGVLFDALYYVIHSPSEKEKSHSIYRRVQFVSRNG
jgi:hypothetical protein